MCFSIYYASGIVTATGNAGVNKAYTVNVNKTVFHRAYTVFQSSKIPNKFQVIVKLEKFHQEW